MVMGGGPPRSEGSNMLEVIAPTSPSDESSLSGIPTREGETALLEIMLSSGPRSRVSARGARSTRPPLESLHMRTSSACKTLAPLLPSKKLSGVSSSARFPASIRLSMVALTRLYVSSCAPSRTSSSASSSPSSSDAVSSWSSDDLTDWKARGGRMSRDSLSFLRSSRISFACLCFVVSRDALIDSKERLVISRSAI